MKRLSLITIVQLARDAGMKYIVITAKHLEGFAMYDSDVDDFNIHDAGGDFTAADVTAIRFTPVKL